MSEQSALVATGINEQFSKEYHMVFSEKTNHPWQVIFFSFSVKFHDSSTKPTWFIPPFCEQ